MTLTALRQQLAAGETTPAAILEKLAGEIAARDGAKTGAYLSYNLESALAEAATADLSLPLGIGYGIAGRSPVDTALARGTGDASIGLAARFGQNLEALVNFTHYLGRGEATPYGISGTARPAGDGDFLSFSIRLVF